ncbi:hypothetical protein PJI17_13270 [Mycobacterium kansasii]
MAYPSMRCNALTLAPRRHRQARGGVRASCGVIDGKLSSAFWHLVTTPVNTRAPFGVTQHPAGRVGKHQIVAALADHQPGSSSASVAGNGTERRSHVFGVLHTGVPDSVTGRHTFTRRRNVSKDPTWSMSCLATRLDGRTAGQSRAPQQLRYRRRRRIRRGGGGRLFR